MANQQITRLLPKEYEGGGRRPFKGKGHFITFLIIVLILVLMVYAGLLIYEKVFLKKQIDKISSANAQLTLEERIADIKKVIKTDRKLDLLNQLLNSHIYFSQFFKFLEDNTLSKIYFNKFSASLAGQTVSLSGKAASYSELAKQIKTFSEQKEINKVDVSDITLLPDGRVSFSMNFNFDKSLLLRKLFKK